MLFAVLMVFLLWIHPWLLIIKFIGDNCRDSVIPLSTISNLKFDVFLSFVILLLSHLSLIHVPVEIIEKCVLKKISKKRNHKTETIVSIF